jgi:hypothetical protein
MSDVEFLTVALSNALSRHYNREMNIPLPQTAGRVLETLCLPFKHFLVLHEAEALGLGSEVEFNGDVQEEEMMELDFVRLWWTVVLTFVGILESFVWISYGAYRAYNEETVVFWNLLPFLIAFSWVYAAIHPIAHPSATPPYDLFTLYLMLFSASLLQIGGFIFDLIFRYPPPSP